MNTLHQLLFKSMSIILTIAMSSVVIAQQSTPYIYVLAVAQDAGYPQAGCFKPHYMPSWTNKDLKKNAMSLAVIDLLVRKKYLFEPTPDFPQ